MSRTSFFRAAFALVTSAAFGLAAACGNTDTEAVDEEAPPDLTRRKDGAVDEAEEDGSTPADDAGEDGGLPARWPTCDAKPAAALAQPIRGIWKANPKVPTEAWIAGAYVTAISRSGCAAKQACQIFLQSDLSYPSLASAAKQAIKMFVSSTAASRFEKVKVGDRVDALGWARRNELGGQNELLLEVNAQLPGCMKTKSSGATLVPLSGVALSDLNVDVYENTHGPLFVRVENVSGKPDASPTSTFGLYTTTDSGYFDAGPGGGSNIVSLSPFFLPNATFTGLDAGVVTRFSSITGVFGLFNPSGGAKYLQIYPRQMTDVVRQQ